jgi:hypothetical protein
VIELDHITPRARGGADDLDNLRVRCRAHNLQYAEQAFGKDHVARKIRERRDPDGRARHQERHDVAAQEGKPAAAARTDDGGRQGGVQDSDERKAPAAIGFAARIRLPELVALIASPVSVDALAGTLPAATVSEGVSDGAVSVGAGADDGCHSGMGGSVA